MKKFTMYLILIALLAGCTGTFQLTRKVYEFQTQPEDKWVDEVLFLAFVIVPVYGASTLVDAVVFNSIEFWTGENPMTTGIQGTENTVAQSGQDKVSMKYDQSSQDIEVVSAVDPSKSFILTRTDNGVTARSTDGKLLFTSVRDSSGGITVYDQHNAKVAAFSPEEVQAAHEQYFR